jgi:hypothetical protein
MTEPPFFDTNILLYSISRDGAEAEKRERAVALLDGEDGALSVQVLQEFYVQATRPTRRQPLSHDIATGLIRRWSRFRVQEINLSILGAALEIRAPTISPTGRSNHCRRPSARLPRIVYRRHESRPSDRGRFDHQPVPLTRRAG